MRTIFIVGAGITTYEVIRDIHRILLLKLG